MAIKTYKNIKRNRIAKVLGIDLGKFYMYVFYHSLVTLIASFKSFYFLKSSPLSSLTKFPLVGPAGVMVTPRYY